MVRCLPDREAPRRLPQSIRPTQGRGVLLSFLHNIIAQHTVQGHAQHPTAPMVER